MKIYFAHSANSEFEKNYPLLKKSFNKKVGFVFPYDKRAKPINSRQEIKNCDLIFAEVSHPSTGLGIELGWADSFKKKIICFHKKGSKISRSLKIISKTIIDYKNAKDLVARISGLKEIKNAGN
jgi:hypothetical protein